jgi:hypothetical protein
MEWVPKQMSHAPLQGPVVTRWTGSHSISNHSPRDASTVSSLLGLPLERFHLGKHRNKLFFVQPINAADKSTHHVNIIFHWALALWDLERPRAFSHTQHNVDCICTELVILFCYNAKLAWGFFCNPGL